MKHLINISSPNNQTSLVSILNSVSNNTDLFKKNEPLTITIVTSIAGIKALGIKPEDEVQLVVPLLRAYLNNGYKNTLPIDMFSVLTDSIQYLKSINLVKTNDLLLITPN